VCPDNWGELFFDAKREGGTDSDSEIHTDSIFLLK
jgi:hypothetical protein